MKRTISLLLFLVVLLPLCAAAEWNVSTAVVNGQDAAKVHLRAQPDTASASLGLFFTGTEVTLLSLQHEGWAQVQIGSQQGYMMRRYLLLGADPGQSANCQPLGVVNAQPAEAPVWYTADQRGEPDGWVNEHISLQILGETVDHLYYAQAAGLRFYIRAADVSLREPQPAPVQRASRLLGQVLLSAVPYVDAATGSTQPVSGYDPGLLGTTYVMDRYAVADLDRDGAMEVALEITVGAYPYGYLLLDERNGQVYGYESTYRGLLELKQDGTASWSNGAGNNGFGWRGFWNGAPEAGSIAFCDNSEGDMLYVVNGQPSTEAAFGEACRQQSGKPDAVWYAITEANLALTFEGEEN